MTAQGITEKSASAAPGPYLGFSLQQVRFCERLLTAEEGDSVSIELLDDVAVHRDTGYILEQTKSALRSNPVADSSVDLWKTFANWMETITSAGLDVAECKFSYFVTPLKEGKLVHRLSSAISVEDCEVILNEIGTLQKKTKSEALKAQLDRFLAHPRKSIIALLLNFELEIQQDPLAKLDEALRILPPESRAEYRATAIGLAVDLAEAKLRKGENAIITTNEFRTKFWAYIKKNNFNNALTPSENQPTHAEVESYKDLKPNFVRQLDVIDASSTMVMTAISDFLRSQVDKIFWGEKGYVFSDSFDELDTQLKRRFDLICDEVDDDTGYIDPCKRGRTVFRRCIEVQAPLEGRVLPSYFIPGTFNALAEELTVGWHPDYLTLFDAVEE